jgi:23S rRNA (pseudouridine1915-N3)-methyltransferase
MKFKLIHIGKLKEKALSQQVGEYHKRIGRFAEVEEVVIPDLKKASALSAAEVKKREGEHILGAIKNSDHVILLDEKGKSYTSRAFAKMMDKHFMDMRKPMVFVTGGAFGFSDAVYSRANAKMALSEMTFSHQLIRLIFAEQLYRGLTIIKGHPYHND